MGLLLSVLAGTRPQGRHRKSISERHGKNSQAMQEDGIFAGVI